MLGRSAQQKFLDIYALLNEDVSDFQTFSFSCFTDFAN